MTAWSYSSLTAFETCPRRYKLTRITKEVVEPPYDHRAHGNDLHKAVELAVKGEEPMPAKYKQYIPIVEMVRATEGAKHVEQKFGITSSFASTTFFGKDVWLRGVIDLNVIRKKIAITLDWKTGKVKNDNDQLKLFAAATFTMYPFIETVHTGYAWLAHGQMTTEKFERADLPHIWQEFIPRVRRVDAAAQSGEYPPRPSGLCQKWCPVPKAKCEFSGKA